MGYTGTFAPHDLCVSAQTHHMPIPLQFAHVDNSIVTVSGDISWVLGLMDSCKGHGEAVGVDTA